MRLRRNRSDDNGYVVLVALCAPDSPASRREAQAINLLAESTPVQVVGGQLDALLVY